MQPGGMAHKPLRLVCVNVNGLVSDAGKRSRFFAWLTEQHFDIVAISETHASSDRQAGRWLQQGSASGRPWQGSAWWCHNRQARQQRQQQVRGVGLLVRDGVIPAGAEPAVEYSDSDGRLLRVGWDTPQGQHWSVVVVYAPSVAAERPAFYSGPYMDAL